MFTSAVPACALDLLCLDLRCASLCLSLHSLCLYLRCTFLVLLLSHGICKLCSTCAVPMYRRRQYADCMWSPSVSHCRQPAAGQSNPASNTGLQQQVPRLMLSKVDCHSHNTFLLSESDMRSGVPSAMERKSMMRMEGAGRSRGWASSPLCECQPSSMPGCTPSAPGGHQRSDPCLRFCTIHLGANCALSIPVCWGSPDESQMQSI